MAIPDPRVVCDAEGCDKSHELDDPAPSWVRTPDGRDYCPKHTGLADVPGPDLSRTCQSLVGGPPDPRCGRPAAFVTKHGAGFCLACATSGIRSSNSDEGYIPVTPEARAFIEDFRANYVRGVLVDPEDQGGDDDEWDEDDEEEGTET